MSNLMKAAVAALCTLPLTACLASVEDEEAAEELGSKSSCDETNGTSTDAGIEAFRDWLVTTVLSPGAKVAEFGDPLVLAMFHHRSEWRSLRFRRRPLLPLDE